ncbi:MAG: hypothetical protein ABSE21_11665 [Bryobacteraceae bacterium]
MAALEERLAAFAQQRHTAAAALAVEQQQELEALVGGGVIEVGASTRHAQEVELLDRALGTLQGERGQLLLAVEAEEARKLRERAQQLREQATALLEKARPLLAKLGEMFNVDFGPEILFANIQGVWSPNVLAASIPPGFRSWPSSECGGPDPAVNQTPFATPKHRVLWDQALELDRQAQQIEDQAAGAGVAAV